MNPKRASSTAGVSRRDFLKAAAAAGAGLTLGHLHRVERLRRRPGAGRPPAARPPRARSSRTHSCASAPTTPSP